MQGFDVATPQDVVGRRRLRVLPRGPLHAAREVALWAGFALAYEAARGAAAHEAPAMRNARDVVELERRLVGLLELDLQRPLLRAGGLLLELADWTYWLAQFVVVALVLVWIYLRRNHVYPRVRNAVIVANTVGLAGYVLFPLAPPRLLPGYGFVDALARAGPLDHRSGIVELFSNPYAAMPSLHTADALLLGLALATLVRRRVLRLAALLWPVWVSFCLIATGNHYWLDIAVGAIVAAAAWIATGDAGEWGAWLPSPGRAGNPHAIRPEHRCPRETSHRHSVHTGKETRNGRNHLQHDGGPSERRAGADPRGIRGARRRASSPDGGEKARSVRAPLGCARDRR